MSSQASEREVWYSTDVADFLGIKLGTWTSYRTHKLPQHNPPPPPDGKYGNRPYWYPETIINWNTSRLGPGHWVKKPRKALIAKRVKWPE